MLPEEQLPQLSEKVVQLSVQGKSSRQPEKPTPIVEVGFIVPEKRAMFFQPNNGNQSHLNEGVFRDITGNCF